MKTTKEPKPESITTPSDPLPEGVDQLVDASLIDPHPSNRKIFPEDSLVEMEASVREHGILQRPTIRPVPGTGRYQLVFGERRWRGATRVDPHYSLPVTVRPLSDRQTLELQKIENLQREDLDPIEEGRGLRQMMTDFGYTLPDLLAQLGKSKSHLYARIKLGSLCDLAVAFYRKGAFSESVAIRIARLPSAELQERFLAYADLMQDGDGPDDWDPEKCDDLTDREAARIIEQRFMKELKGAPFDPKDAALVPVVLDAGGDRVLGGACTDCPLRAGNQPDFDPKRGRADICLNPSCYRAKAEATFEQKSAKHEEAGGAVLRGDGDLKGIKLDQVFGRYGVSYNSPLKPSDGEIFGALPLPGSKGKKAPSLRELADHFKIPAVLALDPHTGETLKLYPQQAVMAAAAKAGLVKKESSGYDSYQAQQKREQEKRRREQAIRAAQLAALLEAVSLTDKSHREHILLPFLQVVLSYLAFTTGHDTAKLIVRRHELTPKQEKNCPPEYLRAIRDHATTLNTWQEVMALIVEIITAEAPYDKDRDLLTPFGTLFGHGTRLNLVQVAAKAAEEYDAKKKPAKGAKAGKGKGAKK